MTDVPDSQAIGDCDAQASERELARLLFAQAHSTSVVGALTFCVAAAILFGSVDTTTLLLWLALGLVSQVARVPLFIRMARQPEQPPPVDAYTVSVALAGVGWGLLSLLFWSPELSMVHQIVIVMFPMALSVAAVTSYCSSLKTYAAFVLPAQLPFVGLVLLSGDSSTMALAAPALLFLGGQFVLFRRFNAQIVTSIRLTNRNQTLVGHLSDQNQELAAARDQAEVASRAKSEFLSRVSHEFRTPINGIVGPLQLMSSSALDARQKHLLDTIRESSDRLLKLVNDVVEVSSLESVERPTRELDYSLRALVADLMSCWQSVADDRQLGFDSTVDASVPEVILGDEHGVRRLLEHLVSNAIEFTHTGGVTVHATLDTVVSQEPRLRITVSDTGVGIAPKRLDQIFDDFVQGSDSMTRQSSGTGLGLSIVRRLASSMGGTVSAVSDPGIGSTFLVLLPLTIGSAQRLKAREAATTHESTHRPAPGGDTDARREQAPTGEHRDRLSTVATHSVAANDDAVTPKSSLPSGLKALVAEDNRVNQMVIEAMLDGLGCAVEVAENGAAAVSALEEQSFDIVFMDCQMPVMDGFKATTAIRQKDKSVPIVAVTANALSSDRDRCYRVGMNDFLSKPFDSESLEAMLVRWVGRSDASVEEVLS